MILRFFQVLLLSRVALSVAAEAADFAAAEAFLAPSQVKLGMSTSSLKAVRPNLFDGPEAVSRAVPNNRCPTLMEVLDLGKPSQISYWYLLADDKLVGILRTRNLVLLDDEARNEEAMAVYQNLTVLLEPVLNFRRTNYSIQA